jgi:hypothetical protein
MPTKSRDWLEAECLKLAKRTLSGSEIQYVAIRRLRQEVADIAPQPSLLVSEKVRVTLARLAGIYALEDEGE